MKYTIKEHKDMIPDDSQYEGSLTEDHFEIFTMNSKFKDVGHPDPNHANNL